MLNSMININNRIEEMLPIILEVFVSYYGEKERDKIEKSFKNVLVCGYLSPSNYKLCLNKEKMN